MLNSSTQKFDFNSWLFQLIPRIESDFKILDLGSGTGAQTKWFLDKIGENGHVCALDASAESLGLIPSKNNLDKYVLDFNNFRELENTLFGKKFDIINSTYAIYYCDEPLELISLLRSNYLNKNGSIVIAGPTWDHDLFALITNKFGDNAKVRKTIDFMETELTPYLRSLSGSYELHYLNNLSSFASVEDAQNFIKSTSYGAEIDPGEIKILLETLDSFKFRKTSLAAIF